MTLTDEEALGIINIRYTMGFTAYQKYMTTTIASNVSRETMTDVLENSADLKGVAIEETTLRVYNDSVYLRPSSATQERYGMMSWKSSRRPIPIMS